MLVWLFYKKNVWLRGDPADPEMFQVYLSEVTHPGQVSSLCILYSGAVHLKAAAVRDVQGTGS